MKLLIVDDSNVIRQRIARLAGDTRLPGLEIVGQARNGAEALNLFVRHRPDVVTMDLTMPELGGVECTEQIAAIDDKVNILVVSALSDKSTAITALKKGARGFLYKPFTDDQLVEALLEMLPT
ncbi:two-component system chemotaxis response regulator CheY [Lysobacter enzymogenes]|jgi:two-component system chemotaxis response regulator CheY|uniref:response regulator n=1 Tax=Lysobacter enzymogenes TaxID=69 RepID=UPI000896FABB|nr:response regulator [Lysobacter enzymogenes]MBN7138525.1 response regulator receiver protein [Lysobacter enzymogenes]SDW32524.1 two-component system, chemotaxis family, response regulator CheY [Lysobacter enzymogenes]